MKFKGLNTAGLLQSVVLEKQAGIAGKETAYEVKKDNIEEHVFLKTMKVLF